MARLPVDVRAVAPWSGISGREITIEDGKFLQALGVSVAFSKEPMTQADSFGNVNVFGTRMVARVPEVYMRLCRNRDLTEWVVQHYTFEELDAIYKLYGGRDFKQYMAKVRKESRRSSP